MATFTVKIIRQDIDTYTGIDAGDADEAISKAMGGTLGEPTITQNCVVEATVQ